MLIYSTFPNSNGYRRWCIQHSIFGEEQFEEFSEVEEAQRRVDQLVAIRRLALQRTP